jgi:chorismate dehydratase
LLARTEGLYVYDLAEQWRNWTGRPFVFAFWAVRRAALSGAAPDLDLAQVFRESRDHGLQHVSDIVAAWAPKLSLPAPVVRDYLTTNIDYTLDEENLQGLQLFYRYAAELQVLPPAPPLRFLEQPRMASKL